VPATTKVGLLRRDADAQKRAARDSPSAGNARKWIPSERADGVIKLLEQQRLRPEDIFHGLTVTRIGEV
jgi:hypothetical protein